MKIRDESSERTGPERPRVFQYPTIRNWIKNAAKDVLRLIREDAGKQIDEYGEGAL
jgi:hypothetical protein